MAELVECRDDITGGHIERTQSYLRILLNTVVERDLYHEESSTWKLDLIIQSAQLHDVGKIAIKDSILKKPGKLTAEEFEKIKGHTLFGEEVITGIMKNTRQQAFLNYAKVFAGSHHENWDGTGYPRRLKETEIPLLGRLMAIVDVYDALVSVRPYKGAFSHEEAVKIISDEKGTRFDPSLIELFVDVSGEFNQINRQNRENQHTPP
jgi:putative two-component system response regulator